MEQSCIIKRVQMDEKDCKIIQTERQNMHPRTSAPSEDSDQPWAESHLTVEPLPLLGTLLKNPVDIMVNTGNRLPALLPYFFTGAHIELLQELPRRMG